MAQITLFLAATYGVSWTLWYLLRADASQGSMAAILGWIFPVVWSPTIIALTLMLLQGGPGGLRHEVRACLGYKRGSGRWFVVAGLAAVLPTLAALLIARLSGDGAPFTPLAALPVVAVMQVLTGAVGEELGWRGFLLPRLGKRLGDLGAGVAMALLWALWHLPAFSFPGMPHQAMSLGSAASSLLFAFFFGICLAFMFARSGGSVLPTMLAHLGANLTLAIGGVAVSSVIFWGAMASIYGSLALFVVLIWRSQPLAQD